MPVNRTLIAVAAAGLLGATAGVSVAATRAAAPCRASQLRAAFAVVPGSAGAGNIVYRLALQNRSASPCFVSGLPAVMLLGRSGRALPTHVLAAHPGAGAAAMIALPPAGRARADARFSPDVPGPGEPGARCEPVAYRLRVAAPGGGSVIAPITEPTSVCEHGSLQFSLLRRG
jgi:hypothetical protein